MEHQGVQILIKLQLQPFRKVLVAAHGSSKTNQFLDIPRTEGCAFC